ncbi:hypothetical protein HBH86_236610 [Parastagonospora nodorum]|nr:hypothetical protein HBH86_236610 [Parastagonospora nodorum]
MYRESGILPALSFSFSLSLSGPSSFPSRLTSQLLGGHHHFLSLVPLSPPSHLLHHPRPKTPLRPLALTPLANQLLKPALQAGEHMQQHDLYARRARHDDGEVVLNHGAEHRHGEAVRKVGPVRLLVDEVYARGAGGEDERAEEEEQIDGEPLRAADVQFPREDERHGVQDDVVGQHEAAVEVVEVDRVDAAPAVFGAARRDVDVCDGQAAD